jgi:hypothetical protein
VRGRMQFSPVLAARIFLRPSHHHHAKLKNTAHPIFVR